MEFFEMFCSTQRLLVVCSSIISIDGIIISVVVGNILVSGIGGIVGSSLIILVGTTITISTPQCGCCNQW